ncbi:hypothetical protein QA641_14925 [Bradyrhizobium sp. CB1650]|uniref:hypothetical protein n=1 Tax=Bradyrhizobium sp. CB1650 TaxID=3039153 RepID=UPI00243508EF|nr:hypothetical protein [Bradyrhizobium sp. CB1650]WGD56918.1 hypothetical protein QA641_14925 [Bradyrhizobium sp. CB1650]
MAVGVAKIDAAAAVPVIELAAVEAPRCAAIGELLRLRGPNGARDEFILAAIAQNLRKMAKLIPMPTLRPA